MSKDLQHSETLKQVQNYADGLLPKNLQADKLAELLK